MQKITLYTLSIILMLCTLHSCKQKENSSLHEPTKSELPSKTTTATPGFVHAVYFWLKKDNPELVKEFINEGLPKLAEVSSIQSVSWGPPAGTPREVVDNSYDLAWIVNFTTAEDQDAYQIDPIHLEFVEKYKSIFDRVQVYDNTVSNYYTSKK